MLLFRIRVFRHKFLLFLFSRISLFPDLLNPFLVHLDGPVCILHSDQAFGIPALDFREPFYSLRGTKGKIWRQNPWELVDMSKNSLRYLWLINRRTGRLLLVIRWIPPIILGFL